MKRLVFFVLIFVVVFVPLENKCIVYTRRYIFLCVASFHATWSVGMIWICE